MNRGSSGLLGLILVVTLFGTHGSRSTVSASNRGAQTLQATNAGSSAESALPCVSDACALTKLESFICGAKLGKTSDCGNSQAPDGGTEFMIATLPDPTRTHLALFFDRLVDAIEQGIQDSGYLFDRALMPWDTPAHPESTEI